MGEAVNPFDLLDQAKAPKQAPVNPFDLMEAAPEIEEEMGPSFIEQLSEAMIKVESNGEPGVVSPAGAKGLMQLMPGTAKDMGVDRNNPFDNITGGQKYIEQQLTRFGDLETALVAYNAGPENAKKFASAGKNYSALPKPQETQPYVQKVMANLNRMPHGSAALEGQAPPRLPTAAAPAPTAPTAPPTLPSFRPSPAHTIAKGFIDALGTTATGAGASRTQAQSMIGELELRANSAADMTAEEYKALLGDIGKNRQMPLHLKARLTNHARDIRGGKIKPNAALSAEYQSNYPAQAGEAIKGFSEKYLPIAPEYQESWDVMIGQGLGSTGAFILPRFIPGIGWAMTSPVALESV